MPARAASRNVGLDLLRLVAVVLVLGRHEPGWLLPSPLGAVLRKWQVVGWTGVDLFFVLSGFLVSGLLFAENQTRGSIRTRRFIVRRWLRTLPPFWILIAVTVLYNSHTHVDPRVHVDALHVSALRVVRELSFVQNYFSGIWNHTWSLAIEEHFYLLLPATLWLRSRFGKRDDPTFEWIVPATSIFCVASLTARIAQVHLMPHQAAFGVLLSTHLRMDSLAVGVLMAQQYHFHRERFDKVFTGHRTAILIGSVALVSVAFFADLQTSVFLRTIGFTLIYIGFAGIVGLAVVQEFPASRVVRTFAALGGGSYSIYLWHEPILHWVVPYVSYLGHPPDAVYLAAYIGGSIVFGYIAARLIEIPTLRARERLFPSYSSRSM